MDLVAQRKVRIYSIRYFSYVFDGGGKWDNSSRRDCGQTNPVSDELVNRLQYDVGKGILNISVERTFDFLVLIHFT